MRPGPKFKAALVLLATFALLLLFTTASGGCQATGDPNTQLGRLERTDQLGSGLNVALTFLIQQRRAGKIGDDAWNKYVEAAKAADALLDELEAAALENRAADWKVVVEKVASPYSTLLRAKLQHQATTRPATPPGG